MMIPYNKDTLDEKRKLGKKYINCSSIRLGYQNNKINPSSNTSYSCKLYIITISGKS